MTASDYQLQAALGSNVMRISLNQNFWLPGCTGYDSNYAALVQTVVAETKAAGMSVILDLHWSNRGDPQTAGAQQPMADSYSITFWQQVAAAYKDDPEVMFELYNEPHSVSCSAWMNGGGGSWNFNAAGMQQLYNAVRGTGANNIVIVGGLNYAYDLTCLQSEVTMTGTNIVFNTHPYFNFVPKGTVADWNTYFGFLLPNYPVMATEFGNFDCSTAAYETWLAYTRANGIHWMGWAWYDGCVGFEMLMSCCTGILRVAVSRV